MSKYVITAVLVLALIPLISGCTFNQAPKEETKITQTQGVGVLEFKALRTDMVADAYNYVLLSVRNNAEGNRAKNITVSLENVEPFSIYEGTDHAPGETRSVSNQFFDDLGLPYRSHRIRDMLPDEEIQFFWNIQSPLSSEIVDMAYAHKIYYMLSYDYTSTLTQTIAALSEDEYLELSKEAPVTLSGKGISSPGELKLESQTQQPLIYSEGDATGLDFLLEFSLNNIGTGVTKPGTSVIIALKNDSLTQIDYNKAETIGWKKYPQETCDPNDEADCNSPCGLAKDFNSKFNSVLDFQELTPDVKAGLMLFRINSTDIISGKYTITMPLKFLTEGIYEPQKILTFDAYIGYTYLKEGVTTINVYPIKKVGN